ncbi:hypothetical protein JDV02_005923 [Purpureocillium takamizusanense]|uniref:Transmembrane protein n=1 Tax=Purpureocillium takamizusanense TaxID=2060973 RepID=A0A9Q8QFB7_9HYPO|nr:uncharacterized protein JDV02_005923 [Purpureocillium takamizusanense]UNI19764.1 hypothetical protein JDV02_005923 [Purpureocillium takamizusanense]
MVPRVQSFKLARCCPRFLPNRRSSRALLVFVFVLVLVLLLSLLPACLSVVAFRRACPRPIQLAAYMRLQPKKSPSTSPPSSHPDAGRSLARSLVPGNKRPHAVVRDLPHRRPVFLDNLARVFCRGHTQRERAKIGPVLLDPCLYHRCPTPQPSTPHATLTCHSWSDN